MLDVFYYLSLGIVWFPLALLTIKLVTRENEIILFWLFLVASGLIDFMGHIIPMTEEGDKIYYPLHLVYLCVEGCLILSFCLSYVTWSLRFKAGIRRFGMISIFFFTMLIPLSLLSYDWENFILLSAIFSASLLILFSFISAFALLGLAETNFNLLSSPWFWILSGIFTYSFGSFFIDLLFSTEVIYDVYFLRHIMNVMRGSFFLIGVIKFYIPTKNAVSP
jgi:hypothetical protein